MTKSKTIYGQSPWLDTFPRSRVPAFPRHRGHLDTDVVIVGGGLTGCAAAYAFAAAGVKVALVEAESIGRHSAEAAGWLGDDPGVSFVELEKALGLRAARHAFQSWRRGALEAAALIRRLGLKCHLESRATLQVGVSGEHALGLKKEQKVRRAAGLDAPLVSSRAIAAEAAIGAAAGLRTRDGATLDPYRAALGLAAAAVARGAKIFEKTPAIRTRFRPKWVDVQTTDGTLRAQSVVVATGVPTSVFRSLQRHVWFRTTFLAMTEPVPARIRKQLGRRTMVVRDLASPPHLVRWVDDERLLVAGADAGEVPSRQLEKTIVQRTGQLMYELSTIYPDISGIVPAYGWASSYGRTSHGLPFIGPHRNFPRHLFAFADSSGGVTGSFLASRILLRHFLGESDAADEAFAFTR
jgi:glycine/D-amino acid oxidase-like deaminating enzyme